MNKSNPAGLVFVLYSGVATEIPPVFQSHAIGDVAFHNSMIAFLHCRNKPENRPRRFGLPPFMQQRPNLLLKQKTGLHRVGKPLDDSTLTPSFQGRRRMRDLNPRVPDEDTTCFPSRHHKPLGQFSNLRVCGFEPPLPDERIELSMPSHPSCPDALSTEEGGFEPPEPLSRLNGLANRRLKPLGHSSMFSVRKTPSAGFKPATPEFEARYSVH